MSDDIALANHSGMAFNVALFGLAAATFAVLLIMEKRQPYRVFSAQIQKQSFFTNTSAFLLNNLILTILKASSLFLVAEKFAGHGLLAGLDNGLLKGLLAFALFDLAIYGWHYAGHKFEWLWRFHKIHHSDKSFNVSTGIRFHVLDLLLEIVYKCVFVVLIGVNAYLILSIEIIELFFIFFHHANIRLTAEPTLSQWIITPGLHRTHHSTLRSEHDNNYGIVLAVWDRIFHTRLETEPENIGLDLMEAENLVQLFSLAFITERQMKKLLGWIPNTKKH
jgi:sterol desaturase/sphingolipid hydroxylase (fatty acid hydroxylase superfamily)